MTGDIQVETGELRSHANEVSGLANRMADVAAAAQHMALGWDAYGILGQLVATNLQDSQETGASSLQAIADRMTRMVEKLQTCAAEYDRIDDEFAHNLLKAAAGDHSGNQRSAVEPSGVTADE